MYKFAILPYVNAAPFVGFLPDVCPNAELIHVTPRETLSELVGGRVDAALVARPAFESYDLSAEWKKRSSVAAYKVERDVREVLREAEAGKRLNAEQAILLHDVAPFYELGRVTHKRRSQIVGGETGTFIIDRNISFTNVCVAEAFFKRKIDIHGDMETGLKPTAVLAAFFQKWPYRSGAEYGG